MSASFAFGGWPFSDSCDLLTSTQLRSSQHIQRRYDLVAVDVSIATEPD